MVKKSITIKPGTYRFDYLGSLPKKRKIKEILKKYDRKTIGIEAFGRMYQHYFTGGKPSNAMVNQLKEAGPIFISQVRKARTIPDRFSRLITR